MFILNKISGVISECSNMDVIKSCKKDEKHYRVADTKEELMGETPSEATQEAKEEPKKDEDGETPMNPPENDSEGNAEAQEEKAVESADYSEMSVEQLRKIAKEKGIQGYSNMNKGTLVEVIKAHE